MGEQHWSWQFGKLTQAVGVLVTGTGDVRNRVWAATEYLNALHPEMLPSSCRKDLEWIQKALTKYPATEHHKSAMEATYHRTRNASAKRIAQRIWSMYHEFQTELQSREIAQARSSPKRPRS